MEMCLTKLALLPRVQGVFSTTRPTTGSVGGRHVYVGKNRVQSAGGCVRLHCGMVAGPRARDYSPGSRDRRPTARISRRRRSRWGG